MKNTDGKSLKENSLGFFFNLHLIIFLNSGKIKNQNF